MPTLAAMQEQLEGIQEALTSGELLVQYGDPQKKVRYRNIDELQASYVWLEGEINKQTGGGKPALRRYAQHTQGWR